MRDIDRLLKIVNNPSMPVQIIFAGKAHPADEPGKLLIQEVYRMVKDSHAGGRLVFLEDYDMNVARYLVQGVDIWMNTPRRPLEASGTSGQKAAINGVLNFSCWMAGGGKDSMAVMVGQLEMKSIARIQTSRMRLTPLPSMTHWKRNYSAILCQSFCR